MNPSLVEKIVNALIYEGYILYPYRPTTTKNGTRFPFGRVYPAAYSEAQNDAEPAMSQTECLVDTRGGSAALDIVVRFLHPITRTIGVLYNPVSELPAGKEMPYHPVPEFRAGERLYQSWQEARERRVEIPRLTVAELLESAKSFQFSFSRSRSVEPIRIEDGRVAGVVVRTEESLQGTIDISAVPVDARVIRVTLRIGNTTPVRNADLGNQEEILGRTFASTHAVLNVSGGEFLSLCDPPVGYAAAAAACRNLGTWPVLVGNEEKRERDTLLSSPIILYDYPKIAPESPDDLCDATEIDEILTLRIMTMTDEEKQEMRNVDDFARRMLERTESLTGDHLMKMHGVMRDVQPLGGDWFNPRVPTRNVLVQGVDLKIGDRVRIRPKGRADAMDIALRGKTAVVEAIEEDAESRIHLALVLEDDPGKDLGMMRQPRHRFFYGTDEVEPLVEQKT